MIISGRYKSQCNSVEGKVIIWRVPEWLGTSLENLGDVKVYRVRFPDSPPIFMWNIKPNGKAAVC